MSFTTMFLIGIGGGLIAGAFRRSLDRFGAIRTAIAAVIVVFASAGCAMWLISRPSPVQAQPQVAAVRKAKPAPVKHKPRRHRRYIQYPGF
jgi:hypothetical protein